MAFYCKNLEKKIFSVHLTDLVNTPDELIIISGYLGPSPVEKLKDLPFKTTVIGGMYPKGVNENLYHSLSIAKSENKNLTVLFSEKEIHSKIYIWLEKGQPKLVLIGSANFSDNGLRSDFRESLADMDIRDSTQLVDYIKLVKSFSTETPLITTSKSINENENDKDNENKQDSLINNKTEIGELSVELPLYATKGKKTAYVAEKSGLNWGNPKGHGHTALGDAYIAIPSDIEKDLSDFFPPFVSGHSFSHKKLSDPVEILWDDGKVMKASLEGKHRVKNQTDGSIIYYPKQISSYSDMGRKELGYSAKSILGRYLRNRMQIPLDKTITLDDLDSYGRRTITMTKISDGVYSADFSVDKKQ